MANESTFWLTLTNILLGAVTVLFLLAFLVGTLCEIISKLKLKRKSAVDAELNHDMHEMFSPPPRRSGEV